tara:strand:+ start:2270 stop:2944 length:675 start_codon:yes stop_codon:yes gene_type:complete
MKLFYKSLAIVALAIGFTSCSEDTTIEEFTKEAQLKTYSLSRDIDGSYTLEHTLSDGTSSSIISDTNGSEIILSEGTAQKTSKSNVLPLLNGDVKIDFIGNSEIKIPGLSIFDSKTSTTASSKTIDYVQAYKISMLEDGSFKLDFKLAKNYTPVYEYNDELGRNEIHLEKGITSGKNRYTKNYLKFEGQKLNIVFVRTVITTTLQARRRGNTTIVEPPEVIILP